MTMDRSDARRRLDGSPAGDPPSMVAWSVSVLLLLPARLLVGGVLAYAGAIKIADPQALALSIKAYEVLDPSRHEHLIGTLAFVLPWTELIAGALLLLGLRARSAALACACLLGLFTAVLASAAARGLALESCGCFGEAGWPCEAGQVTCFVLRAAVLFLATLVPLVFGPGLVSADGFLSLRPAPRRLGDDGDLEAIERALKGSRPDRR